MGSRPARGEDLLTMDAEVRVTFIEVIARPLAMVTYLAQQVSSIQPV